ncbi:hypothetical protein COBT_001273 [Conglomerata obtusa]
MCNKFKNQVLYEGIPHFWLYRHGFFAWFLRVCGRTVSQHFFKSIFDTDGTECEYKVYGQGFVEL